MMLSSSIWVTCADQGSEFWKLSINPSNREESENPIAFGTCPVVQRKVVCPIGVVIVTVLSAALLLLKAPMLLRRTNMRTRSFKLVEVVPTCCSNCWRCNSNWPDKRFNCRNSAPITAAVNTAVIEFAFKWSRMLWNIGRMYYSNYFNVRVLTPFNTYNNASMMSSAFKPSAFAL